MTPPSPTPPRPTSPGRSVDDLRRHAADQGFTFELSRYAAALATHESLRDALLRLRAVPLSFLAPTEPASALVWLENGGVSAATSAGSGQPS